MVQATGFQHIQYVKADPIVSNQPESKIKNIVQRAFESYLSWFLIAGITLLSKAAMLASPLTTIATLCYFMAVVVFRKELFFEGKMLFCDFAKLKFSNNFSWYNQITEQLYLGAMPLATEGHLQMLQDEEISLVIFIGNKKETTLVTVATQPVNPRDYKSRGIDYCQVSVDDCYPPSREQMDELLTAVEPHVKAGKKIFIHCASGRGRSPLALSHIMARCSLANTPQAALEVIKRFRPSVHLTYCQESFLLKA